MRCGRGSHVFNTNYYIFLQSYLYEANVSSSSSSCRLESFCWPVRIPSTWLLVWGLLMLPSVDLYFRYPHITYLVSGVPVRDASISRHRMTFLHFWQGDIWAVSCIHTCFTFLAKLYVSHTNIQTQREVNPSVNL